MMLLSVSSMAITSPMGYPWGVCQRSQFVAFVLPKICPRSLEEYNMPAPDRLTSDMSHVHSCCCLTRHALDPPCRLLHHTPKQSVRATAQAHHPLMSGWCVNSMVT